MPTGLRAANHFQLQEQASHQPLVWMLLLSQAGVGMLLWEALAFAADLRLSHWSAAFAIGLVALALGLATLHLGQPLKAWRFMLGLRTSWMSREILAFNLFMTAFVVEFALNGLQSPHWTWGKSLLLGTGLLGVYCSTMIYVETRRAHWTPFRCFLRFGGTTLLLGMFGVLLVLLFEESDWARLPPLLLSTTLGLLFLKCVLEAREFFHSAFPLENAGLLDLGTLASGLGMRQCLDRFLMGTGHFALVILAATACFIGEYCERSLFFRSALSRGMPGL